MFHERRWLLTLALLLPNWLALVAVRIIRNETRRAEEFLANPPVRATYGQSWITSGIYHAFAHSATKKAAEAQYKAFQAELALAKGQATQYGDGLLNRH